MERDRPYDRTEEARRHSSEAKTRERFAALAQTGRFTVGELCHDFGISRKTGHKYLKRYRCDGREGLADRSRRPRSSPNATAKSVEALILKERTKHPTWGPKKIRDLLIKVHRIEHPPHESTIALTLSRHGLSQKRKRKTGAYRVRPEHLTEPTRPNQVWTVDFKGWFLLGDGQRCDTLTVCDRYSRYIIGCRGCFNQQFKSALRVFKKLMRHHGLPEIIRVDNGTPFASNSLGGLSQLSIWWIEQGIRVEFMTPASPQENGSHERMHRDLKAEATKPPSRNMPAQRKRQERWRREYNYERPHESSHWPSTIKVKNSPVLTGEQVFSLAAILKSLAAILTPERKLKNEIQRKTDLISLNLIFSVIWRSLTNISCFCI